MSELFVYKIRRKSDGMFSTGGDYPSFTKKGKAWSCIGHLKNHLHNIYNEYSRLSFDPYKDSEIVQFKMVLDEGGILDINEVKRELGY